MKPEKFHAEFLTLVSRKIGRELRCPAPIVKRYLQGKAQPVPFLAKEILKTLRKYK